MRWERIGPQLYLLSTMEGVTDVSTFWTTRVHRSQAGDIDHFEQWSMDELPLAPTLLRTMVWATVDIMLDTPAVSHNPIPAPAGFTMGEGLSEIHFDPAINVWGLSTGVELIATAMMPFQPAPYSRLLSDTSSSTLNLAAGYDLTGTHTDAHQSFWHAETFVNSEARRVFRFDGKPIIWLWVSNQDIGPDDDGYVGDDFNTIVYIRQLWDIH